MMKKNPEKPTFNIKIQEKGKGQKRKGKMRSPSKKVRQLWVKMTDTHHFSELITPQV